ncbi:(-)-alpha-terpineol synthase-like isoform X3 [Cornus florida]|uniref:(-)-alpha-terpineol synthase-like isoform X3 n=1 Tax=Cornus florida TaxID=4283 RepID=UPI0028A0AD0A|nr:(-)-alpha-terpineol synthase-like isoform X3 [Cornus florida]
MAFATFTSTHLCILTPHQHGRQLFSQRTSSKVSASLNPTKPSTSNQTVVRRSGNYKPSIWEHHYLQSISSVFTGEEYTRRADELKGRVKMMLEQVMDPLDQLELIDVLQRLGLSYHFMDEISKTLEIINSSSTSWDNWKDNLYATSLQFRILRQHGFHVPQDVFSSFLDDMGKFEGGLCGDTNGMLCLYEASYFSIEGERILEEAKDFTTRHLKENLEQNMYMDQNLAMQVGHSLELPLHWRTQRLETRWFIDIYEQRHDMNLLLLELAKLDFNMVQATHLEEMQHMTRWDINALEQLPYYMKICFIALYNSINEMAYDVLKENGSYIISYMKKMCAELCNAYLIEAKWYHSGYTPTLSEYLGNAWMSISGPLILIYAYFFITKLVTKEALEYLEKYPSILRHTSIAFRLADDLGTSSDELKRGDVPKSIQCYMHETGASEEEARDYIKCLIGEHWKKMNEDLFYVSPVSKSFVTVAMNLARTAQYNYQYGDGFGVGDRETKDRVLSILIEPIKD